MTIKAIEVENLLSFDRLRIDDLKDVNCIVGKNNTGKSNLLKLIHYFYNKLEGRRELPPKLCSNYSSFGCITLEYDTTRIFRIVTADKNQEVPYFKHIYNELFYKSADAFFDFFVQLNRRERTYRLTLTVNSDESTHWSKGSEDARKVIANLYPFFEIQTRHIDLYDWNKLWNLVARLKSFNVRNLTSTEIKEFFDKGLAEGSNAYSDYVDRVQGITRASKYSYREKVLNYVKVGLEGETFMVDGQELELQSDGTNSYNYVETFLRLLISLTRRDYIEPAVFVDEPEIGLHPKLSERLIESLYSTYDSFKKRKTSRREIGRYATPYPKIIFATHSPSLVKSVIKLFTNNQRIIHFSTDGSNATVSRKMQSEYRDQRFLNVFGDDEARLFFSEFIVFVEGETELELFGHSKLCSKFPQVARADVYKANSVELEGINPDFSNASIPYLILYDLDKLFRVNVMKKIITIKPTPIELNRYLMRYRKSYCNSEERQLGRKIRKVLKDVHQSELVIDGKKMYVEQVKNFYGQNIEELAKYTNSEILAHVNHYVFETTIEGALVSISSSQILKKWLVAEVVKSLNVESVPGLSNKLKAFRSKTDLENPDDVLAAIDSLCKIGIQPSPLSQEEAEFVTSLKKRYVRIIIGCLVSEFRNEKQAIVAVRLLLNGKTDTLVSKDNVSWQHVDADFRQSVDKLKTVLVPFVVVMGKTGGWVTRFLDFAITDIDKNTSGRRFEDVFRSTFPELYAILQRLLL